VTSLYFTPIGLFAAAALVSTISIRPLWFGWCLPVIATLQTHALFVITAGDVKLGASLFNGAMFVASGYLVMQLVTHRGRDTVLSILRERTMGIWAVFTVYSLLAAAVCPVIFSGIPVAVQLDHNSVYTPLAPLKPNLNNLAQAVNSIGVFLVLLAIRLVSAHHGVIATAKSMAAGVVFAAIFTILINLLQRAHYVGLIALDLSYWASNPSMIQSYDIDFAAIGSHRRTALPFIEPSYAGAWFGAIAAGALTLFSLVKRWAAISGTVFVLSILSLVSTMSATGWLSFGVWLALFSLVVFSLLTFNSVKPSRYLEPIALARAAVVIGMLLALAGLILLLVPTLRDAVFQIGSKWSELLGTPSDSIPSRGGINSDALAAFTSSYGLGMGTGSVKASGFFHGLLANGGIIGSIAFVLALCSQAVGAFHNFLSTDKSRNTLLFALFGATSCLFIALAGGISDQNWPVLWVFIALGYLVSVDITSTELTRVEVRGANEPH
jgi:hypothetical protein